MVSWTAPCLADAMSIESLQEIVRATYALDGGSIRLYIVDDTGSPRYLELVQHRIPMNSTVRRRIGRLYFDDRLIDVRSSDETAILNFLRTASVHSGCESLVEAVITFVQSNDYIQLAQRYSGKE